MQNKHMNLFTHANNTLKNGAIDLNFSDIVIENYGIYTLSDWDAKKKKLCRLSQWIEFALMIEQKFKLLILRKYFA